MKGKAGSGCILAVITILVDAQGKTETVFNSPEPYTLIKSSGLGDAVKEERAGEIVIDCGRGIYEEIGEGRYEIRDYFGVIDKAKCCLTERVPSRIIKLMPREQKLYKDLLAQEYIERIHCFSKCGCNPRLIAFAKQRMERIYEYEYQITAGNKRGVSGIGLWTTMFQEVVEPANYKLGRYEGGDIDKKKYYIIDYSLSPIGSYTSLAPLGIEEPVLQAGQQKNVVMTSLYPPGVIKVDARCAQSTDSDPRGHYILNNKSDDCIRVLDLFYQGWLMSLSVGPREDLAELMPDELAMKLIEEVPKFIEVGWARKEVARSLVRDLERIAKAGTAKDAARIARELAARTSKMREEECSIECRSIIGVNLEIMLKDLERWQERERLRAAGANR